MNCNFLSILTLAVVLAISSCTNNSSPNQSAIESDTIVKFTLTEDQARHILSLPVHCLEVEYPNKMGQVLGSDADLKTPKELRPIFYGCFDWHSSVHGYWSIVELL